MALFIDQPTQIKACGNIPKIIQEYIGAVNTKSTDISIARMTSPAGWTEPGQTPEFNEYTVVLKGTLHVQFKEKSYEVKAGQAVIAQKGEWVQYSSPDLGGAEYIAICTPAFSPETVHRDAG